jgi:hypothetical protein
LLAKAARGIRKGAGARSLRARRDEQKYIRGALAIYREAQPSTRVSARRLVGPDLEDFHVKLFMHQVEYKVRGGLERSRSRRLRDVRRSAERSRMKVEEWFNQGDLRAGEFVREFNRETILFQVAAAGVLTARQYQALFDLAPGETVILADPRIVKKAFGSRSRKR